ncbi:MAG: hypothetical protein AAGI48_03950 [Verrucomicrobiota bacterium]
MNDPVNIPIFYLALSLVAAVTWFVAHLFIEKRLRRAYDKGWLDCAEKQHIETIETLKDSLPDHPTEKAKGFPELLRRDLCGSEGSRTKTKTESMEAFARRNNGGRSVSQ